MTGLWLAAVALLVVALLFVIPPLLRESATKGVAPADLARRLYADQLAQLEKDFDANVLSAQDRAQAIDDLQRQALEESSQARLQAALSARPWMGWGVAGVLSLGLPAAALVLYLHVGNPIAMATQVLSAQQADSHENAGTEMEGMVSRLALRLRTQPDDVEGWIVLARSYEVLQRYDDAVVAYQKAVALAPNQPQLLADYADALGSARDGDLTGPAQAAIDAALAIDANHPKALALAGMAAFKRGDVAAAGQHWKRVLELLPTDSDAAVKIAGDLARLGVQQDATPRAEPTAQPIVKRIGGTVSIATPLLEKVSPQDTVFVLARAPSTGRMPVAVLRLQAKDLPAKFVLDDSLAMSPDLPISRFDVLTVEVRVTRSGQAAPQSGDLTGTAAQVTLGKEDLVLLADKMIP